MIGIKTLFVFLISGFPEILHTPSFTLKYKVRWTIGYNIIVSKYLDHVRNTMNAQLESLPMAP